MSRVRFRLRQVAYDLGSGLFFRPLLIIALLALLSVAVTAGIAGLHGAWMFPGEPAAAQIVLGTIASSMMTVVSVVYSILLVALSLASMQFSTRILRLLVRDKVSQVTLGIFVGTFLYCLLLLRVVQTSPPYVPGAGVGGAIVLALLAMAQLIYFIHHIAHFIQANFLIGQLAEDTEVMIDEIFSAAPPAESGGLPDGWASWPRHPVVAHASGYVQILDVEALAEVARAADGVVVVRITVGHFATAGLPILELHAPRPPTAAQVDALLDSFDLGAIRTMQDDAEWGIRQIVDVALKAISPAVNDPSTAATCVDHLGRLLVRAAGRHPPRPLRGVGADGRARVVLRESSTAAMVDLAFNQIRQYGRTDMAVQLRVLRALAGVAEVTTEEKVRQRVAVHARLVLEGTAKAFPEEDCEALHARYEAVVQRLQARGERAEA